MPSSAPKEEDNWILGGCTFPQTNVENNFICTKCDKDFTLWDII